MSTDSGSGPEPTLPTAGADLEEPEADVIEQHLPVDPDIHPDSEGEPAPPEAGPAEQRIPVDLDEPYPPTV